MRRINISAQMEDSLCYKVIKYALKILIHKIAKERKYFNVAASYLFMSLWRLYVDVEDPGLWRCLYYSTFKSSGLFKQNLSIKTARVIDNRESKKATGN